MVATVTDRTAADAIVKVPEMAESISEGTLKQFVKRMLLMTRLFVSTIS
jgi:hypothetical protein